MTRHGTLAYYLAAWVIGCFVVSLPIFASGAGIGQVLRASMLLETYFFALIFGALDALLFAFLLRRSMRLCGTHALWIWVVAGGGLAFVLVLVLGKAFDVWNLWESANFKPDGGVIGSLMALTLFAPDTLRHAGLWQVPIEGAAIAAVLCLVDRAFNNLPAATPVPPATPETKQATV
jgi:hypothetical protein